MESEDVTEKLPVATYRGASSTPWQFSVVRTPGEIRVTQARGPPEKFDPVVTSLAIEERAVGIDPIEFEHTVSRRV